MEEKKVYEYNGFIVLKKKKKSGVLKIAEGKLIFYQGNTVLIELNQIFMKDLIIKCSDMPVRKILFSKPEKSLIITYKDSSIIFVNELHSYEEIYN